jgi:pseudouridine synthase
VGRLDRDSGGLLLLTTDGELAFRIAHPRYRVVKTYEAEVGGVPGAGEIERLRRGVALDDGLTAPAEVELLNAGRSGGPARLRIAIHEGRKRQLRRMLEAVGHRVLRLTRTDVGGVSLGELAPGAWRPLTKQEDQTLRRLVALVDTSAGASI